MDMQASGIPTSAFHTILFPKTREYTVTPPYLKHSVVCISEQHIATLTTAFSWVHPLLVHVSDLRASIARRDSLFSCIS